MELIHKKKTIIEVDYKDLQNFIFENSGVEYDIVSKEEMNNDSIKTFVIYEPDIENKSYQYIIESQLEIWKKVKEEKLISCFVLEAILQGLCSEGKIESGNYLVKVSW
jgi:hypothetical protein